MGLCFESEVDWVGLGLWVRDVVRLGRAGWEWGLE